MLIVLFLVSVVTLVKCQTDRPCMDTAPVDCSLYDDVCNSQGYKTWAQINCRKHCGWCNVTGPTTTTTQATTTTIPFEQCVDKVSCSSYGEYVCTSESYKPWATTNCPNYCNFCVGPTTPAPPCEDKIDNCNSFDASVCTSDAYSGWAQDNCRRWCGFCVYTGPTEPPTTPTPPPTTTTIPPELCFDKISNCKSYGDYSCRGDYEPWGRKNCPHFCGFCKGLPEPPKLCQDKLDNCDAYDDSVCTNKDYTSWAEANCRKRCKFCKGDSQNTTPLSTVTESNKVCEYKGKIYKHGAVWNDGCSLVCKCIDSRINHHLCKERCPKWNLGPDCKYINVPGQCCPKVRCGQNYIGK